MTQHFTKAQLDAAFHTAMAEFMQGFSDDVRTEEFEETMTDLILPFKDAFVSALSPPQVPVAKNDCYVHVYASPQQVQVPVAKNKRACKSIKDVRRR